MKHQFILDTGTFNYLLACVNVRPHESFILDNKEWEFHTDLEAYEDVEQFFGSYTGLRNAANTTDVYLEAHVPLLGRCGLAARRVLSPSWKIQIPFGKFSSFTYGEEAFVSKITSRLCGLNFEYSRVAPAREQERSDLLSKVGTL